MLTVGKLSDGTIVVAMLAVFAALMWVGTQVL
jgi:hypothetical protein